MTLAALRELLNPLAKTDNLVVPSRAIGQRRLDATPVTSPKDGTR